MKKIGLLAFVLLLLSTAVVVRFVRPAVASGTIYIRADGSVYSSYSFTDNVNDSRSLVKKYFPVYNFSAGERWYPCSFYFDNDTDLYNKDSYDSYTPFPPPYYAYVHIAENTTHKTIQYWLYSVWNHHEVWPDHDSEWDSTIFVILEKTNGNPVPVKIYYFFHQAKEYRSWDDWPEKENTTHPVVYVANGSHGAYSSPEEMISNPKNFYVSDTWQPGGPVLREEDFNWYLVGDSVDHGHDPSEEYCNMTVEWIEGEPQWEFEENYWWPREFPQYPLLPMDPPWHRLDWMKGEITSPTISILSPENKTYSVKDVPLTFTVSESTSWIGYTLDGQANVTITGNTTLTSLLDEVHYVVVYANNTAGNMGTSSMVYFTVDTTPPNITDVSQTPPKNNVLPEDEVKINATVTDYVSKVEKVTLNFTNGNGTWITVDMTNLGGNVWNATIPAFPYCTNVTYIVIAEDNANNTITTEEMEYECQYHVIPEFPTWTSMLLILIVLTVAIAIYKQRLLKTPIH